MISVMVRAGHRGVERRGVRGGLAVHGALGRGVVAVVLVDGHAEAQRQQGDSNDQSGE
jgi:hypothetical protein